MAKLSLYNFFIGYADNEALAAIYYTVNNKPCDHQGNILGSFSADIITPDLKVIPFSENHNDFVENLIAQVIPKLNKGFRHSIYKATEIVDFNNGPHPYIAIRREDNKKLSTADMSKIKKLIDATLQQPHVSFFNQNANTKNNKVQPTHHYQLRSHKQ